MDIVPINQSNKSQQQKHQSKLDVNVSFHNMLGAKMGQNKGAVLAADDIHKQTLMKTKRKKTIKDDAIDEEKEESVMKTISTIKKRLRAIREFERRRFDL